MPVLITVATGKVSRHLVQALLDEGARVIVLTRTPEKARTLWPGAPVTCRAGDLVDEASLAAALVGIECVFHLASYSPGPDEADIYEAPAHWTVSADGTRNLVAAVLTVGIRKFVYLSSIKVMGDAAGAGSQPADEHTTPLPDSLYGRAKLEAERQIHVVGGGGGLLTCVLRLPMVYGLAGQGNIARMIDAVARHRFPPGHPSTIVARQSTWMTPSAPPCLRLGTRGPPAKSSWSPMGSNIPRSGFTNKSDSP